MYTKAKNSNFSRTIENYPVSEMSDSEKKEHFHAVTTNELGRLSANAQRSESDVISE